MRGKSNYMTWLLILFLTLPIQARYGGGTGEPNDPYLIYTAVQMNTIGSEPNDWDKHFKLMADIDLSVYVGTDFNIIGSAFTEGFAGVFDGNEHTISNFTCVNVDAHGVGIFGYVDDSNARICNLGLIDPNVNEPPGIGVGSLAGWVERGTITNCYVVNGCVTGYRSVGGLVGHNGGTITNCHVIGNVTGRSQIGGLVGNNEGAGVDDGWSGGHVDLCYTAGIVNGHSGVGGLIGSNNGAGITNCYSTCDVSGESWIGGLMGNNEGHVANCYSICTVDAEDVVGGLIGMNEGIIMASYSTVRLLGAEQVGGLVGYNVNQGEIVDCYASGEVFGQKYVGGLLGHNRPTTSYGGIFYGAVRTSYSATSVSGGEYVGGLVGGGLEDGVHDSFWDMEISGQTISAGGIGKTTAEMQAAGVFLNAGWDFTGETENGTEDTWMETNGADYPVLWWQLLPSRELPAFSGGTGEPNDPYLISTSDELRSIGHKPEFMGAHFKLANDIDLAGVHFSMIGSRGLPFRGVFDGNGHTVSNFTYASSAASFIGFFRYVVDGQIKDLGLVNPNINVDGGDFHGALAGYLDSGSITNCYVEVGEISGNDYTGGLVSQSTGTITGCYTSGSVIGYGDSVGGVVGRNDFIVKDCFALCSVQGEGEDVGGLVGENTGTVTASYSHANVRGGNAVGGLVGRCSPGEITNCYAQGDVVGEWYVGGLVGSNASQKGWQIGNIRYCYSTATVSGGSGFLGADWGGEVLNCFWDIEASGRTTSHNGTGKTTAEMQSLETFLDAGWDFADETANGTEDIWWILEGGTILGCGGNEPRESDELLTKAILGIV
ncbi:MAG: hypothetical protein JXM79_20535 [Sedimentisphaerales bacterium]|nr:hypothetical protein [Sedimentisphaerales bacterium]